VSRVKRELAALATMSPAQLREAWMALCDGPAPALPESLLRMAIGYKLQERTYGALPAAISRVLVRAGTGEQTPTRPPTIVLRPGAKLVRSWHGRTICVTMRDDGRFDYDGKTWRSLSHIARSVTGAYWSGPRFFGLTSRRAS
jgi:hypothetical protein